MRFLYTLLFYALTPVILLRLYWKSRKLKQYRARLSERFLGSVSRDKTPVDVWLHAVSLGEVVAASPLIECFLKKNLRVCVTTMTPTGSAQVLRRFESRVVHQYVPYDFPHALRRFFQIMTPRVGVIMETELWPNLILEATRAGIPLFLANGRISNKAYPQYNRIRWLLRPILKKFTCIMVQSPVDEVRYKALAGSCVQVKMLGNLKFDLTISSVNREIALSMKKALGEARPVLILASTHDNEEQQILQYLSRLKKVIPNVLILIAPRHPERFQDVFALCSALYRTGRRSVLETMSEDLDVVVLDSMGELMSFYSISDFAFVGGSFVPIGGHNVLEPIALNVPVLCGPFMQNSQSIVDELLEAKALIQVSSPQALIASIVELYQDKQRMSLQTQCAQDMLKANQGALARHIDIIAQRL